MLFIGSENSVSTKFIDSAAVKIIGCALEPEAPYLDLISEAGRIKMCHHPDCFEYTENISPVRGRIKERNRIAGQAQFNSNLDCKHYRRKWWKFWVSK